SDPVFASGSMTSAMSRMWSISERERSRTLTMSLPAKLDVGGIPIPSRIKGSYNYLQSEPMMAVQVLAITSDLFLQSRITELAKSLGANARVVTSEEALIREANSSHPNLV